MLKAIEVSIIALVCVVAGHIAAEAERRFLPPRTSQARAFRRTLNILASITVPPTLLITLIVVTEELQLTGFDEAGLWARVVVLIPGFLFLVREFRTYASAIAVVYFPVSYWLTLWTSFYAALVLYGGSP